MPSLAEYYRRGLRVVAEPGTTFAYSNPGFATLGQIVEDVSGIALERYFRERIFVPLRMADTDLVRSDRVVARLATGYALGRHGVKAVPDRDWIGRGSGGIYSTVRDMARFAAALLGGDANEYGSILDPATLSTMFEAHYRPDPRVPGWGLGFARGEVGGHRVVGHDGILPGFNSTLLMAPDDGLAIVAFTNGSPGAFVWMDTEFKRLLRHLLGAPDEVIRTDIPHHPEVWAELCGGYRLPPRISDLRGRLAIAGGVEVFVRGGRLMIRALTPVPALYRGLPLHPDDEDDPYGFRLDLSGFGLGTVRVVFGRDVASDTAAIHADLAGQPLSLIRRRTEGRASAPLTAALGALLVAAAARSVTRRHQRSKEVSGMSVATATELWRMSATELAEAIRTRQVSSVEVVEAHLRRIEAVNPSINAVVIVLGEQALEAAKAADRAVAAGGNLPPLHGVPFTIKDNIDVAGTPTTQGFKALAEAYPTRDSPIVERMKAAGAIPIGRTNLPSGAVRWHCESELWGATINPWDRTRTPGASSAGEAAAIATGMSPLGLGSDGLGSLRHPAQCCGIAALKPTRGRVPQASTIEPQYTTIGIQLTSVNGPLARRVADLTAAFSVMAGPTWRDPWTVPAPLHGPELPKPVRVSLVVDPGSKGTAQQVQEGVRNAATALDDAGYAVDEIEPPSIELAAQTLLDMLSTPGTRQGWQEFMAPLAPADTQRFMAAFFDAAGEPDVMTAEQSFMTRHALLPAWGEFHEEHPLILAPVCTDPPFEAGTDEGRVAETIRSMRMAMAVNALGLPAVALPVGIGDGLPQAVQVIGPRYREDLCLDAAAAIEDRRGTITPLDPR